jgi:hypothetical protein
MVARDGDRGGDGNFVFEISRTSLAESGLFYKMTSEK